VVSAQINTTRNAAQSLIRQFERAMNGAFREKQHCVTGGRFLRGVPRSRLRVVGVNTEQTPTAGQWYQQNLRPEVGRREKLEARRQEGASTDEPLGQDAPDRARGEASPAFRAIHPRRG